MNFGSGDFNDLIHVKLIYINLFIREIVVFYEHVFDVFIHLFVLAIDEIQIEKCVISYFTFSCSHIINKRFFFMSKFIKSFV